MMSALKIELRPWDVNHEQVQLKPIAGPEVGNPCEMEHEGFLLL